MRRLSHVVDKVTRVTSTMGLIVAAGAVVFCSLFILLEISLRLFLNTSTFVLDEFVGYAVATLTFMPLAGAFRNGVHVRVNLVLQYFPPAWQRIVEMINIFIAMCCIVLLTNYIWNAIIRNMERNTVSNTIAEVPIWMVQSLILFGLILLMLELVNYFLAVLIRGEISKSVAPTE